MTPVRTLATTVRVLTQVRRDPRTVVMMLVLPSLLMALLRWVFDDAALFDRVGPALLGLFPFILMFLITSVTTLRERRSGTLERLLAMPLGTLDLLLGYGLAFGLLAALQGLITAGVAVGLLGMTVEGSVGLLLLVAVADGILGTALGLLASAFASTEFQVVQFLPLLVFPQILIGGILVPRDQMPDALQTVSDWLPLTHAVEALQQVSAGGATSDVLGHLGIVAAFAVGSILLAAATLRRRTP